MLENEHILKAIHLIHLNFREDISFIMKVSNC